MKKELLELINKAVLEEFGTEVGSTDFIISIPPKPGMGDYSTNAALVLAKKLGKDPKEVAEKLASRIQKLESEMTEKIEVLGGFINFHLKPEVWFKGVLEKVGEEKKSYGKVSATSLSQDSLGTSIPSRREEKGGASADNVMVEYLSPNTNKPLHLGHLRNGIIGSAVINLLSEQGANVIKAGIINDRGVHICKAMLAYQKWGEGKTPETENQKPDHFVGSFYVKFAKEAEKNPALEEEAQEMLRKWEAGDLEVRELWNKVRAWVLEGWSETEKVFWFSYDKVYFESDVYTLGKDIVEAGLEKGVFRKNEAGNVVFDLPESEFGKNEDGSSRVLSLLRADGTSLYTTQDLGLAVKRAEELDLSRMVYVVGSEQKFHFQSLFAIFKALGYPWAEKLFHLSYGMVYLPEGKMKSREGTVVDADDLVKQMTELAEKEVQARFESTNDPNLQISTNSKNDPEVITRARKVALAAIKFYMLRQKPSTDIYFDPKESLAFEGFTGPYLLYTFARTKSIFRKAGSVTSGDIDYSVLGNEDERVLVRLIEGFPEAVEFAANSLEPSSLANYLFKLAQAFNQFYGSSPILSSDDSVKNARLALALAFSQVLEHGLNLLSIETIEKM